MLYLILCCVMFYCVPIIIKLYTYIHISHVLKLLGLFARAKFVVLKLFVQAVVAPTAGPLC